MSNNAIHLSAGTDFWRINPFIFVHPVEYEVILFLNKIIPQGKFDIWNFIRPVLPAFHSITADRRSSSTATAKGENLIFVISHLTASIKGFPDLIKVFCPFSVVTTKGEPNFTPVK